MKYEINSATEDDGFKPFSVTLTFETRKEYAYFHDNVMRKITKTNNHEFHDAIYGAGSSGVFEDVKGKI